MTRIIIILILLCCSVINHADEIQFILKDIVYIKTNKISFNDLLGNDLGLSSEFQIISNQYFSNYEISRLLKQQYIKEVILIGKGVQVEWINQFSSLNDIKNYLLNTYPGINIQKVDFSDISFPEEFKIQNLKSEYENNYIKIQAEYLYFIGNNGITTNIKFELKYYGSDINIYQKSISQFNNSYDYIYLEHIDRGMADLSYKKGDIFITMKVKIMRKLEDNYYLVENNKSGKTFKVKLKEKTEEL